MDNNSGFGSPEIKQIGLTGTTYTVTNHLPDNLYYWKVMAKLSDGSDTSWSDPWQFTYHLPVYTEPYWVPLYRLYNGDIDDHYYTTIPAHRDDYVQNKGYAYERIECYISDRKFNDANCGYLFHLWDKANNIHFYTSSESEKDEKIIDEFSYEGIVGFIYTQPFDWGVSLYRLYNSANTDYFLTVSEFEKDYAIENYGFSADSKVGYVSPIGILNPDSRLKFNISAGYGTRVGNGNYQYSRTDLRIPGIGMPFVFSRTYNSLNCGADGPLGHGWTHSFQARLIDDGIRVFVFWPDGHADYYNKHDNMTQTNPATAENTGCYDTLYDSEPNSDKLYTITRKDQTKYIFKIPESSFDPESPKVPFDVAQFRSIIDKNGKSIALTYDLNTGNLTTIRDTADRAITFTYYGNSEGNLGHIKTITGPAGRTLTFTYVYGHGLISKITADGNRYCYHFDSRGSTVGMTDGSENLVNKYAYDEYGGVLNSSEDNANPFRYVGKYGVMDEGNGLLFMRARYYDSDTGRFLSKDPLRGKLVDPGTLNRYVYVLGNPVSKIDPVGLSWWNPWSWKAHVDMYVHATMAYEEARRAEWYSAQYEIAEENNFTTAMEVIQRQRGSSVVKTGVIATKVGVEIIVNATVSPPSD